MKKFVVNRLLYSIIPLGILIIIGTYMLVLFKDTGLYVNIINLTLDGIVVLLYFFRFCTAIGIDSEGINFYTIFKKKRVLKSEIDGARQASFLTRINTVKGSFFIITTQKGYYRLQDMLKDYKG